MKQFKGYAYCLILIFIIVIPHGGEIASVNDNHKNQDQSLLLPAEELKFIPIQTFDVWVTAYSSSLDETDDTPLETASRTGARKGVVAANFLPFGTEIKIPEFFGDRIFCVEDRMHKRRKNFVDIWMPTKRAAKKFGIKRAKIVVVEDKAPKLGV